MQETPHKPPERLRNRMWLRSLLHCARYRGILMSIVAALALVALDVVLSGTYTLSVIVCPIWLLLTVVKSASNRPGWKRALLTIAIPALTLGLVLTNYALQSKIAEANAAKIISACEAFHAANGTYPKNLAELVPKYMRSVPRAKYCLTFGAFLYFDGNPMLFWYTVPPFGRKIYYFEERRWYYLD